VRLTTQGELPNVGPVPIVVYVAMLGATVAGQLVGMTADALVVGRRLVWVPLACSVVLEALVGARLGAARIGRPLTWRESARVSCYYSIGLAGLSVPLAIWSLASHPPLGGARSSRDMLVGLGLLLAWLLAATALRPALMMLGQAPSTSRERRGRAIEDSIDRRNKQRAEVSRGQP
jgi:hypothetical protein